MSSNAAAGSPRVAFIGTGVMGRPMARNLIEAGYGLAVHNRTPGRAKDLVAGGAHWAASVADAVTGADFVVSIVGFPDDVRRVYLGPGGVLDVAPRGAVAIDMTTSEPSLARELWELGRERGIAVLDAPVSGGDVGARDASLSIMVGGDRDAFEAARPLLAAMGRTVVFQGPAGSGQHTKLANQIAIASTIVGVMEALAYARRAGLDPDRVLESIGAGAAASWTMSNLYPRVVAGDLAPGFYVRHFLKDIRIALAEARAMGLDLSGLALAGGLYEVLDAAGKGDLGTQAVYEVIAGED